MFCTFDRLQGNGLCDRRQRPCRKVTVMGNGFLNSANLTCHVMEFKVKESFLFLFCLVVFVVVVVVFIIIIIIMTINDNRQIYKGYKE